VFQDWGKGVKWAQGGDEMKLTSAQKAANIREAAEAVIARLSKWEETHRAPNLTQIEDEVLALRQQFGEAIMDAVLAGQEAQQPVQAPQCEVCGGEMTYKGRKVRSVESRAGEVEIERGHYYCPHCRSGFFPPRPPA
jgi:hypothetical protein